MNDLIAGLPDILSIREAAARLEPERLRALLADPEIREKLGSLSYLHGAARWGVYAWLSKRDLWAEPPEKPTPGQIVDKAGKPLSLGNPPRRPATRTLRMRRFSEIEAEDIEWLWPGRLALGTVGIILGRQGDGKSTLLSWLAAQVSRGRPWPDSTEDNEVGSVIILQAEESAGRMLKRRLQVLDYDESRCCVIDGININENEEEFCLGRDLDLVEQACEQMGDVRLIVIDPLSAYLSGTKGLNDIEMRAYLRPLYRLAERFNLAVVASMHPHKDKDSDILDRTSGTSAHTQLARMVWYFSEDPTAPGRRLLSLIKGNLDGKAETALPLHYSKATGMTWFAPVEFTARDVDHELQRINREKKLKTQPGPQATESKRAAEFILKYLEDKREASQMAVQEQAQAIGIKESSFIKGLKTLLRSDGRVTRAKDPRHQWRLFLASDLPLLEGTAEPAPEPPPAEASERVATTPRKPASRRQRADRN